jgi:phosphoribosylanthranilate isomerase
VPGNIKKTGVFVNADTETMLNTARAYQLNALQLHGTESPKQCQVLKAAGYEVIKVFGIGNDDFNFRQLVPYKPHVHYFLFDTQTRHHGGSGRTFDWDILQQYDNEIPFFLSGGLSLENIDQIRKLKETNVYAIDVNSRFETAPGQKNIGSLRQLKEKLCKINEEEHASQ